MGQSKAHKLKIIPGAYLGCHHQELSTHFTVWYGVVWCGTAWGTAPRHGCAAWYMARDMARDVAWGMA